MACCWAAVGAACAAPAKRSRDAGKSRASDMHIMEISPCAERPPPAPESRQQVSGQRLGRQGQAVVGKVANGGTSALEEVTTALPHLSHFASPYRSPEADTARCQRHE